MQPPRLQQTPRVRITHAKMTSTSLPYDESVGDVAPSTRLRHLCQKRHSRPKSAKSRCSPSITLPSGGALMVAAPEGHLEVVQYLAEKRCAARVNNMMDPDAMRAEFGSQPIRRMILRRAASLQQTESSSVSNLADMKTGSKRTNIAPMLLSSKSNSISMSCGVIR